MSSAGEVEGVEQVCSSLEPLKERPAYFIAFNHVDKLCLLVVCGTKSGSDALTNAQVPQLALLGCTDGCADGCAVGVLLDEAC